MNFTAYIQSQKNQIRSRHRGELFLISADGVCALRSTEEIFKEMNSLKGLNVREREGFAGISRARRQSAHA